MNESVNRAFMYGESVFTTMLMVSGNVRDWELHFERLKKSVEFVYGPFKEGHDWHIFLRDRLENRIDTEEGDKVIRLTLYREQERGLHPHGLISILDLRLHVDISAYDPSRWEDKRFHLKTVPATSRPSWWPSFLKSGNYLETILTQKKFMGPDHDDILFMSLDDTVLESSVSNIFICRKGMLFTAPPGPHVLEGVMRKRVLEKAPAVFTQVDERDLLRDEVVSADGVFGTNSVRGLFLISRIDDHEISTSPEFLERFEKLKRELGL